MDLLTWLVAGAALAYAVECVVWPVKRHRVCKGSGRLYSPLSRSWRPCWCGDGSVVRWGRLVIEFLRAPFRP